MAQIKLGQNPAEDIKKVKEEQEKERVEEEERSKVYREVMNNFLLPIKELDNKVFKDKNGMTETEWKEKYQLAGLSSDEGECNSFSTFSADEKYLILNGHTEEESHNENEKCEGGGSWGTGGTITNWRELKEKEEKADKEEGCIKAELNKLFMTEMAWAVAKIIKEKKIEIPDDVEGKTYKEKADNSIERLKDIYSYDDLSLKFWIIKEYGEEKYKEVFEKAKRNAYKELKEQELSSAKRYFNYDTRFEGPNHEVKKGTTKEDIETGLKYYKDYCKYCKFFNETPKPIKEILSEILTEFKEEREKQIKELQEEIEEKEENIQKISIAVGINEIGEGIELTKKVFNNLDKLKENSEFVGVEEFKILSEGKNSNNQLNQKEIEESEVKFKGLDLKNDLEEI